MNAIEIFGEKENLEKVCKKAWEIGNFGSTCIDGNELDVFVRDYTNAAGINKLIDYAQENSCYTNVATANFIKAEYGITNLDDTENQRQNALQELIAKRRLAREA